MLLNQRRTTVSFKRYKDAREREKSQGSIGSLKDTEPRLVAEMVLASDAKAEEIKIVSNEVSYYSFTLTTLVIKL